MAGETADTVPLVLLRGLLRDSRHWGDWPGRLAQLTGRPVVCLDLPGNGALVAQISPLAMPAVVAALRRQLRALGVPAGRAVDLLGLSLGGMAALAWADCHPAEVRSLVLINSSLAGACPWYRRLRLASLPLWLSLLWRGPLDREASILALTVNRPQVRERYLPDWRHWAATAATGRGNLLRQLLCAARYHQRRPPACPTLLLAARADRLVDWRCSAALARAWQLPLRLHESAGHDLPLEEPGWVEAQLLDWWQSLAGE